ncbi:MAG: response regulator [Lentisphaerae bacterium]|nr:response regulator [Lentisphaerota bacterium]
MKDGKHVVLCVDDDADFLESLKMMIEAEGYAVATASSAEAGIQAFKEHSPDFVLVDLMMEEIDAGARFVKEIKALGPTPPIYMLSSMGDNLNRSVDYNELGLNGVLQKPVDPKLLSSTLKSKLH